MLRRRSFGNIVACLAWLCMIPTLLGGCASGHQRFFKSMLAEPHPTLTEYDRYNIAAYTGEPKVVTQRFDETLNRRLIEDGFVLLGYSSFNGSPEGEEAMKAEAKRLGAELAITESQYSHTVSGAVPVTTYNPQTAQTTGTVWSSTGSWANYSSTTTGTTSQTNLIPYSVARYDQTTSYWSRTVRPRILGAIPREMTTDERQRVGANQGVVVVGCVRESPAWKANILAGDFILAIDAQAISSIREFADRLDQRAGQRVTLSLMRGTDRLEVPVLLNTNPLK